MIEQGIKIPLIIRIKRFLGIYRRQDKKRARIQHQQMMKIFNAAHFINLKIRIDGEWKEYEADYIKYL